VAALALEEYGTAPNQNSSEPLVIFQAGTTVPVASLGGGGASGAMLFLHHTASIPNRVFIRCEDPSARPLFEVLQTGEWQSNVVDNFGASRLCLKLFASYHNATGGQSQGRFDLVTSGFTGGLDSTLIAISGGIIDAGVAVSFLGASLTSRQTLPAAAVDAATTQALANSLRSAMIAFGLCQ
jgi:hypothetical protein